MVALTNVSPRRANRPSRPVLVVLPPITGPDARTYRRRRLARAVVSRASDDGTTIRRRRECLECGTRFTTYERMEETALVVVKRSGEREPFDRTKIVVGMRAAAKSRPLSDDDLEAVAADIEDRV